MLNRLVKNANNEKAHDFGMASPPTTVGERTRLLRDSKGFDLAPLAKAVGISVSALSQIETGSTKQPKPETLFKIADALDVEPRYLVFGHNQRVAPSLTTRRAADTGRFRTQNKIIA